MSKRTSDLLWRLFVIGLFCAGPAICVPYFIRSAQAKMDAGEYTASFWLPAKSQVYQDKDEFLKASGLNEESSCDNDFVTDIPFKQYQRVLADESHIVWLLDGLVTYRCRQGKVVMCTSVPLGSPSCVLTDKLQYLGNGQVRWKILGVNYVSNIVGGIVIGLILSFGAFLVLGIVAILASCVWLKIAAPRNACHRAQS